MKHQVESKSYKTQKQEFPKGLSLDKNKEMRFK
jgi:hypothetical protein